MPVAGHVPFEVGLLGALAAKQASIEHLRGYVAELVPKDAAVQPGATLRSRTVAWNSIDRSRIPQALSWSGRAGFSPAEVLRLATRAGPEYLGRGTTQGAVAVGQAADLQLVGANPLLSLGNLKDRRGVMAQGRWYSQAELNRPTGQ